MALLVALGIDFTRITGTSRVGVGVVIGGGTLGTAVMLLNPDLSPLLAGVVALGLVVCELVIYRRGLRVLNWTQYAAIASLVVGGVVFALSRTGGPLCQPDSLIQGHGLWHLLTAAALGLWALGALPGTANPMPAEQTTPEREKTP